MRFFTAVPRLALGLFIIAHGLAHAVLPLRGWIDPSTLNQNFMPFILYMVAVVGFTTAGLGILGLRPLTAIVQPALVLASAYSLIAIWSAGQSDLWWGVAVNPALLLVGATGADRYLPARTEHRGLFPKAVGAMGVAFVVYAASAVVLWPLHRSWGSAPAEHALALPGDRPDRNPALELQHAVTVNTAAEKVWPWLVQLGQDRAGFYSYDWLERAFGVDIHNTLEIKPEWQSRRVGERVRATQDDYLGGVLGRDLGWTVKEVEPGRALVLQQWGAFVLEPTVEGKTRFIIRTKVGDPSIPAWAAALDMMAFELPHFIMERRMMLRIKSLAESTAPSTL